MYSNDATILMLNRVRIKVCVLEEHTWIVTVQLKDRNGIPVYNNYVYVYTYICMV